MSGRGENIDHNNHCLQQRTKAIWEITLQLKHFGILVIRFQSSTLGNYPKLLLCAKR